MDRIKQAFMLGMKSEISGLEKNANILRKTMDWFSQPAVTRPTGGAASQTQRVIGPSPKAYQTAQEASTDVTSKVPRSGPDTMPSTGPSGQAMPTNQQALDPVEKLNKQNFQTNDMNLNSGSLRAPTGTQGSPFEPSGIIERAKESPLAAGLAITGGGGILTGGGYAGASMLDGSSSGSGGSGVMDRMNMDNSGLVMN